MNPGRRPVARHTVLPVIAGFRAYGLETAESDTDRRGVFAVPTPHARRRKSPA